MVAKAWGIRPGEWYNLPRNERIAIVQYERQMSRLEYWQREWAMNDNGASETTIVRDGQRFKSNEVPTQAPDLHGSIIDRLHNRKFGTTTQED